ncbi:MAG: ABC transporter ATP-binding protein [Actinomycetota bacterium]|nr:ABC transporter ATP-binding protein [Actinomycetota bacterium]
METVIKTQNLTKKYGSLNAVKSLDLNIGKGEIYGFIGLNGAGKTTTIRMLLGMIRPTMGSVELFGEKINPNSTKIWSRVGFLVEAATAYPELTVVENLEASRRLYQLADKKSTDKVMEKLNLVRYRDKKAKHLSLGNYQRLAVARALLNDPELLILDEPTNGLDPAGIVEIRNLLKSLAENEGVTVFVSSHILGEVYRFTTKIGIIHEGALIDEMDIKTLNKRMGERLVLDAVDRPALLSAVKSLGYDPHQNNAGEVEIDDGRVIKEPEKLVVELIKKDVYLNKVNVEKEDLEQYFLNKVGRHEQLT